MGQRRVIAFDECDPAGVVVGQSVQVRRQLRVPRPQQRDLYIVLAQQLPQRRYQQVESFLVGQPTDRYQQRAIPRFEPHFLLQLALALGFAALIRSSVVRRDHGVDLG